MQETLSHSLSHKKIKKTRNRLYLKVSHRRMCVSSSSKIFFAWFVVSCHSCKLWTFSILYQTASNTTPLSASSHWKTLLESSSCFLDDLFKRDTTRTLTRSVSTSRCWNNRRYRTGRWLTRSVSTSRCWNNRRCKIGRHDWETTWLLSLSSFSKRNVKQPQHQNSSSSRLTREETVKQTENRRRRKRRLNEQKRSITFSSSWWSSLQDYSSSRFIFRNERASLKRPMDLICPHSRSGLSWRSCLSLTVCLLPGSVSV